MQNEPLISLLTPCYNGERHIIPYLQRLLSQTYTNVEYIFINDGSTDGTEEIFMSYREKFSEKGWRVIYKKTQNGGPAAAVNHGLKIFSGKYIAWMDSDDLLYPTYLEEYCSFLENNEQYGFCYARVKAVAEGSLKPRHVMGRTIRPGEPDNFFEDLLTLHNKPAFPFCMARSSALLTALPQREIYESQAGQNLQILLPLAYNYRCGYIDKVLALYLVRKQSVSHGSLKSRYAHLGLSEDVALKTLASMDMPREELLRCCKKVSLYYTWRKNKLLPQAGLTAQQMEV